MDRSDELVAQTKALTDGLAALPGAIGKAIGEAMAAVRPNPAPDATKALAPPPAGAEDAERGAWEQKRYGAAPDTRLKSILTKPSEQCSALELDLRRANDSLVFVGMMHAARPKGPNAPTAAPHPQSTKLWGEYQELATKALSTSAAGSGAEFIPSEMSAEVHELYRLERRLASLFDQVAMPNNPYTYPVGGITGLPYLVAENVNDTGEKVPTRTPTTTAPTWTAKRIGLRVPWSRDFDEASVAGVSEFLNREIPRVLGDGVESALLNGDTAATHMDSRLVTAANDCRKAMNGLRKLARSPSTDTETDISTFTEANVTALLKKMGKYGVRTGEVIWVTSPKVYNLILQGGTNWPSYITVDKMGNRAINVTGEVGAIIGAPLVVTDLLPETCTNASADTAGTAGTDGLFVAFNRRCYSVGMHGGILVEADYDVETLQYKIVGSLQVDVQPWFDATTDLAVSVGYNISVA